MQYSLALERLLEFSTVAAVMTWIFWLLQQVLLSIYSLRAYPGTYLNFCDILLSHLLAVLSRN